MDNQRRGFGERLGSLSDAVFGRKGGVTTPFVTIDNFYRERAKNEAVAAPYAPPARGFIEITFQWILSCRE